MRRINVTREKGTGTVRPCRYDGFHDAAVLRKGPLMSKTTTSNTISVKNFRDALLFVFDEAFDNVHGAFLDPNESLFPTLEGISAADASRPVGIGCSSVAAHVNHLNFYFDVAFQYMRGENPGKQDWASSWAKSEVTEEEWAELKEELRTRQCTLVDLINRTATWDNEEIVGGAFAAVAHTAYHLGQIRHSLCLIRQSQHPARL